MKSTLFGDSRNQFDESNNTDVLRITLYNTFYYYFIGRSKQIEQYPCPLNRAWNQKVMKGAASVLVILRTRSRPTHDTIMTTTHVDTQITRGGTEVDADEDKSPNKRARTIPLGQDAVDASCSSYWPCSSEAY